MRRSARRPVSGPAAEPAPSAAGPRTWQGILYQPCQTGAAEVRQLFRFAGASAPAVDPLEFVWEAQAEGRLVGGVLVERHGEHGFIHGPVVIDVPGGDDPVDVAAQLVASLLTQAVAVQVNTLFTRPQGLDRVWVRAGFVPVPEATLPASFRGRPGTGLYAWRRPGTYQIAAPDAEAGRRRGPR